MTAKKFPGPNPIDDLGILHGPEDLRSKYVNTYRALFDEDSSTTIFAFMALASITSYWWSQKDESPSPEHVEVPLWALQAITIGFLSYRDNVESGGSVHLDLEMGFIRDGQGMQPRLTEKLRRLRDLKVGLAIALDCEKGKTRKEAVEDASAQFLISEKTVWRLWSANKDFVTKTLENFRIPITSGSVENDPET